MIISILWGNAVAQCLRSCATNRKVAGSIPASVSGFFIDTKSFRSHYGPGVDSASNINENQEHFLGVKAAGAVVMNSGNLNFLESCGLLQACNGTALPLITVIPVAYKFITSIGGCKSLRVFAVGGTLTGLHQLSQY